MNWDAVGAIGEVIGACVVFATLLYLAFQVKLARLQMARESRQYRDATLRELMLEIVRNEHLRKVMDAMTEASSSATSIAEAFELAKLSDGDRRLFNVWMNAFWQYRLATYEEIESLSPRQLDSFRRGLRSYRSGPGKLWLQHWSQDRNEPLISYVEQLSSQGGT